MAMPHTKHSGPTAKDRAQLHALVRSIVDLVKKIPPVRPAIVAADKAARAERLLRLAELIDHQIQINLGSWQQQADNAISDAHPPQDEKSSAYFYFALAGNLLWAATCFLNPQVAIEAVFIKIMSVVGASYGSNTLQQFAGAAGSPDDPKPVIRGMVAKKRGELEKYFKGFSQEWAATLDGLASWEAPALDPEQLVDEFDQYIWEQMFPTVPFDTNRFDAIRTSFVAVIQTALVDFNVQWNQWIRTASNFGGAERKRLHIEFHPVLRIVWGGKVLSAGPSPLSRWPNGQPRFN
jgi:hypothetical protein